MVYDDSIGFSFLDILWALHFVSLKVRPESFDQASSRFRSDWRDTTSPADLTSFKRSCVVGKHSDVTLLYHIRNFEGSFDGRTSSSTAVNESGHNWYLRETFHCERLFVFYVKFNRLLSLGLLSMPYLLDKMPSSMITIKTGQAYPREFH